MFLYTATLDQMRVYFYDFLNVMDIVVDVRYKYLLRQNLTHVGTTYILINKKCQCNIYKILYCTINEF